MGLAILAIILYTPMSGLLKLSALSGTQLLIALGLAALSVLWYEVVKLIKKLSYRNKQLRDK